jgi:DNA-directed RNA polymerase subunit RPC12/RpoP
VTRLERQVKEREDSKKRVNMARYQGLGVEIKALLEKLKSSMANRGYKIERVLTGETSFLIEYKKTGVFADKQTISVKGTPDDFIVSGIREDNQEAWFIVEDVVLSSAKNPQAFKSHTETAAAPPPAVPPAYPAALAAPTAYTMPTQVTPQFPPPAPKPALPPPTNCSRCGAPFSLTQEDMIITCRYCGFTMAIASREEIKKHSMLENRLLAQQAAEASQKYMDKGLFRMGVSKEASITNVKLRYVPFWVCPANAYTSFRGVAGSGIMGEIHQAQEAFTDKRASGLKKFGKLVLAGAKAYAEMQDKNKKPQTVASSFSNNYIWPTLARRAVISEINYYDVPAARKIPFDVGKIPSDAEFLNIELNEEEAKAQLKVEIEAKERLIASGRVDSLETCSTNVALGEAELVHAPVWFVHYTLRGENYVIAVDGCEAKVLGGGRPLFKFK